MGLKNKKLFLLDMDGTIYHENTLINGASNFFSLCKERGIICSFMTNNSSKGKVSYVEKLNKLGIYATTNHIASSVNATVAYLLSKKPHAKIYLVGTQSLKNELIAEGFDIVPTDYRTMDVDYVLVGFDVELNYQKIEGACYFLSRGIAYIATNCDIRCPIKENKFIPDCGAICQLIETATDRKPLFLGKPSPYIVESVLKQWHLTKEEVACVGDRLYTDIAVGINAGVDTIAVLTGEAQKKDLLTTIYQPTYVFDSIKELYEYLI